MGPQKRTIKSVVREVLNEDPKTRTNDRWLIIEVLRKLGFKIYIDYKEIKNIPSFESITRARRLVENTEGEFIKREEYNATEHEAYYPSF